MTLSRIALLASLVATAGCFAESDKGGGDDTGASADGADGTSDGADGTSDGADGGADGGDGTDGTEPDPEECADGIDNDLDGDGDCSDEECEEASNCECVEIAWAGTGELGSSDTTDATDAWAGGEDTCGGEGGLDQTIAWSSPAPGCYQVDTFGTEWDTVLRVVDACGGTELACSDDDVDGAGDFTPQSKVIVGAENAGDAFLFVVDGYDPDDFGAYVVNTSEVTGAGSVLVGDLGDATGASVASGDTTGVTGAYPSECGSDPGASVAYSWTAPTTGTYTFDTYGSAFDTILSLSDGTGCTELACNDDGAIETVNESELITEVEAGVVYHLVVSGYGGESGAWVLNITEGDASASRE